MCIVHWFYQVLSQLYTSPDMRPHYTMGAIVYTGWSQGDKGTGPRLCITCFHSPTDCSNNLNKSQVQSGVSPPLCVGTLHVYLYGFLEIKGSSDGKLECEKWLGFYLFYFYQEYDLYWVFICFKWVSIQSILLMTS